MSLSSRQSFLAGIGSALVVFFVVGFFVLLGMVLTEDESTQLAANPSPSAVAGEAAQPSQQAPVQITLKPVTEDDWVKGKRDVKISLIEFSDFECLFCASFHPTAQQLLAEYPDDVNWVYRHFPLTSIHPTAVARGAAAECAGSLGGNDAFWAYTDELFANQSLYGTSSQLQSLAEKQGLDGDDFAECMASGEFQNKVLSQANEAVDAGGRGTPYSVIVFEDQQIPVSGAVPYPQIQSIVDSLLSS